MSYDKYKKKYLELKFGGNKLVDVPKYILYNSFPKIKGVDRDKLKLRAQDLDNLTGIDGANFIADIIEDRSGSDIVITDGTAGVGGDSINMIYRFKKINAIEGDKYINKLLKHNIKLYNLDLRVDIFQKDTIKLLKDLEQDVIYIGNPKYKDGGKQLLVGELEISDFVNKFKNSAKQFVFKVPPNYDFSKFFNKVDSIHYDVFSFKKDKTKKEITFFVISIMTQ